MESGMIDVFRAQILSEKSVLKFPERLAAFSPFLDKKYTRSNQ